MDAPDKPVGRDKKSKVFYWVIPANAAGKWRWELAVAGKPAVFELMVAQNFQKISGNATVDGRVLVFSKAQLSGEDVAFELTDARDGARYEFSGHIVGHNISGSVRVTGAAAQRQLEWDAARVELGTPAHALLKRPTMQELQEKMQP
jgi:hypothetical protein